jgi:hypothetical protein
MPVDIVRLLVELERRFGTKERLAKRLTVSVRILTDWLNGKVQRMRPDNRERILKLARDQGIDSNDFDSTSLRLWNPPLPFDENLRAGPTIPADLSGSEFIRHPVNFLGKFLNAPFGASPSVLTCTADRIDALFKTGCEVVTYKTVRNRFLSALGACPRNSQGGI